MKKILFILTLLELFFVGELYSKQKTYTPKYSSCSVIQNTNNQAATDSLYFTPHYFNELYNYIVKNGKAEKVNASNNADKPMYVEYRALSQGNWEFTVDIYKVNLAEVKANRIYFSMQQSEHKNYGNILMLNNSIVKVECADDSHTQGIYKAYNEILKTINKK